MSIQFKIEVEGPLIRATASGTDDSLEEVEAYGTAVVESCRKNQCKYILCDERRLHYNLSTSETFDLGEYYTSYAPSVVRVAIVCSRENLEEASFFETVAVNRGLQIRVFTDMEEAENWLLKNP